MITEYSDYYDNHDNWQETNVNFVRFQERSIVHAGLALHFVQVSHYLRGKALGSGRPWDLHLDSAAVSYVQVYRGSGLRFR